LKNPTTNFKNLQLYNTRSVTSSHSFLESNQIFYLKRWADYKDKIQIQKIIKFNINFNIPKRLNSLFLINGVTAGSNALVFNFKNQFKISFKQILLSKTWTTSIGVILKTLKILEKRERKLEKNKSLFLSYVIRYLIRSGTITYLTCKYFSLNIITFLRKFNFFKKLNVQNLIFYVSSSPVTLKKVRRIKRRLKKRLLKYENTV